jgi:UDP-glucose 4-epimerase
MILVTGGAGYIGSVVVKLLIENGYEVIVYDNLSRGHLSAVDKRAIFVKGDLADKKLIEEVFRKYPIEAVLHFAAYIEVGESVKYPTLFFDNNVKNCINLLNAMCENNCKKIIFSSSAAVYGEPLTIPIKEDHPLVPINPYGETKRYIEELLFTYEKYCDLKFISLRYFNVAGADGNLGEDHRPETHLIPLIVKAALGKERIFKIYGDDYPTRDGTCIRDYIHVYDLATAHILALEKLLKEEKSAVYNLGSENGYSVKEVFETACEVIGKKIPYEIVGRRPGDVPILIASSQKIKKELGWQRKKDDLKIIISDTFEWQKRFPNGYPD